MRSEALKRAQRKYRQKNPEKFKQYTYKYREEHKEKIFFSFFIFIYTFNKRNYNGDPIVSIRTLFREF